MVIKCIVVDDEPVARDLMSKYIKDVPSLNLVKVCSNALEASETLMQEEVDLIFLDINMPKLSGMKFYRSLHNPPYVIFTTAYPEFAAEGFEVDAIDYLLKPFPFDRFLKAVDRALDRIARKDKSIVSREYILLRADKKLHRINLAEIQFLESMGDYVKVYFKDTFILVHDTLKRMLELLPDDQFIQVHKSYVIAIGRIQYVEGNQVNVGNQEIPIGKNYSGRFFNMIKK
jgi:DNA-binding LytR/AlgR family response regulator